MTGVVLLVAAGSGTRLGRGPKALVEIGGRTIVRRAADAAAASKRVQRIVVAIPAGTEQAFELALEGLEKPFTLVAGGATRQASVGAALAVADDADAVAVHDAARALCPVEVFDRCIEALEHHDVVLTALPVVDTIKRVDDGVVTQTVDREGLWAAQTPQGFRAQVLRDAHAGAAAEHTDDVALVDGPVHVIMGDVRNFKITTPDDLELAEAIAGCARA